MPQGILPRARMLLASSALLVLAAPPAARACRGPVHDPLRGAVVALEGHLDALTRRRGRPESWLRGPRDPAALEAMRALALAEERFREAGGDPFAHAPGGAPLHALGRRLAAARLRLAALRFEDPGEILEHLARSPLRAGRYPASLLAPLAHQALGLPATEHLEDAALLPDGGWVLVSSRDAVTRLRVVVDGRSRELPLPASAREALVLTPAGSLPSGAQDLLLVHAVTQAPGGRLDSSYLVFARHRGSYRALGELPGAPPGARVEIRPHRDGELLERRVLPLRGAAPEETALFRYRRGRLESVD